VAAMVLKLKDETKREIKRKSIHMIPGILGPIVVLLPAYLFGDFVGRMSGVLISLFFFLIYTLNELYLRGILKRPVPIASSTFEVMARQNELEGRTFMGPVYFWGVLVIMFMFLDLHAAMAGVWISAIGDAAAAIFGKQFGKTKIPYNKRKSVQGTLAFFLFSFVGVALILLANPPSTPISWLYLAILASLLGAFLESLPGHYLLDEITVPLITTLFVQFIGGYNFSFLVI